MQAVSLSPLESSRARGNAQKRVEMERRVGTVKASWLREGAALTVVAEEGELMTVVLYNNPRKVVEEREV